MSTDWNHVTKYLISSVFLSFFLLGCKQITPVENGSVIGDITGKSGEKKWFSVTVPESMDGLLIQASGDESVTIDLLDENENSLGQCPSESICLIDHPSPAKYLISLTSTKDYSGISLSASWGGETQAVLQNNAEVAGVGVSAGGVLIKSFYLSESQPLVEAVTTATGNSHLQIVDRFGEVQRDCPPLSACRAGQLSGGVYFLRLMAGDGFAGGSMKVLWGDATGVTLQNGIPKALEGAAGDQVLNTLYLPAGADSLLVTVSQTQAVLDILDSNDALLKSCEYGTCSLVGLDEGVYRVRATLQRESSAGYFTAAWGGAGLSLIENGGVLKNLIVSGRAGRLIPVYLSEAVETGMLHINRDFAVDLRVFDSQGGDVSDCLEANLCVFGVRNAGVYFFHAENFSDEPLSFDLTAAWAGPGIHTLADGSDAKRYSLAASGARVESFYLSDNIVGAMIRSGGDITAEIISPNYKGRYGVQASCREPYACAISNGSSGDPLVPGPHFVRITNQLDVSQEFGLAMAWAGEPYPTLVNGIKGNEKLLEPNDTLIEVVSLPPGRKSLAALLLTEADLGVDVFSLGGEYIDSCAQGAPCVLEGDEDYYYLSTNNNSGSQASAALASAWANETVATLPDGVTDLWLSLEPGEKSLQSISMPGNFTDALLMMRDTYDAISAVVYDRSGEPVADCDRYNGCYFSDWSFDGEEYFAVFHNESRNETAVFKPVLALASESLSTMGNGDFKTDIVLEPNELRVESLFVFWPSASYGGYVTPYRPSTVEYSSSTARWPCEDLFCEFNPGERSVFIGLYNYGDESQIASLSTAWTEDGRGSLTAGRTFTGLSGAAGDQMLQSFVSEKTGQATITSLGSSVEISILNSSGWDQVTCQNVCSTDIVQGNTYYFRIRFLEDTENATVTITW